MKSTISSKLQKWYAIPASIAALLAWLPRSLATVLHSQRVFFISFSRISCISRFGKFLNSKLKTKNSKLVGALLDWFSANARDLPWRRTRDPYAIWVSEIMLQQTQVKTVMPYWERWMRELPTIEAAAKAPSEKIHKLWEGLGYYTRVRNLQKAAQQIVAQQTSRRRRG